MNIGRPMQENVQDFFKNHQRYPSFAETEKLLHKSGCRKIKKTWYKESTNNEGNVSRYGKGFNCSYNSISIEFSTSLSSDKDGNPYIFGFSKGNSVCSAFFYKGGYPSSSYSCRQNSCLLKNLSH